MTSKLIKRNHQTLRVRTQSYRLLALPRVGDLRVQLSWCAKAATSIYASEHTSPSVCPRLMIHLFWCAWAATTADLYRHHSKTCVHLPQSAQDALLLLPHAGPTVLVHIRNHHNKCIEAHISLSQPRTPSHPLPCFCNPTCTIQPDQTGM
jgi:hypothetical protein